MSRDSVMRLMPQIDPEGTNERNATDHLGEGSYFVWHVYCYEKLKPDGFYIHGAIDEYNLCI
jgi:hypothetical protein